MRTKRAAIALVSLLVLVGWAGYAHAEPAPAASVVPSSGLSALITNSTTPWNTDGRSYGWRFFVAKPIVITHIGVFGMHRDYSGTLVDNGLNGAHQMGIWGVRRASAGGGLQLLRGPLTIGPGGTVENHYVYVPVVEPLLMTPDDPTYERLLIGVWTGNNDTDLFYHYPVGNMTINAVQAGAIQFQNFTYYRVSSTGVESSSDFVAPWGGTLGNFDYFALNFKYAPAGPKAEAGPNAAIYTSEQALTTISGTAAHTVAGTAVQYRWLEGSTVLQAWTAAGTAAEGNANLSLAAPVPTLAIGAHTLTLEVTDGTLTASDTVVLTVDNTPPEAQPTPTYQVLEIGKDAIIVTAQVADFDGGELSYQWVKGGEVLDSNTVDAVAGGAVVDIPDLALEAGDARFPLGIHEVQLVVSDGVNPAVTAAVTVEVKDTTAPTLAPTSSVNLLWPPNHQLCPVTVWATSADNGGGLITLDVSVQSSEEAAPGEQDWYIDSTDNEAGIIALRLRAERAGTDSGRVYTITITATDERTNTSVAKVVIRVPHDQRKTK